MHTSSPNTLYLCSWSSMLLSQLLSLLPARVQGHDLSASASASSNSVNESIVTQDKCASFTTTSSVTDLEKASSFNATSDNLDSKDARIRRLSTVRLLFAHIGFVLELPPHCYHLPICPFQCGLDLVSGYDRRSMLPQRYVCIIKLIRNTEPFQTIVSTSLPTITSDLGATQNQYTWVGVAYMLTQTACQPLYGRISDLVGRKVCTIHYELYGNGCFNPTHPPFFLLGPFIYQYDDFCDRFAALWCSTSSSSSLKSPGSYLRNWIEYNLALYCPRCCRCRWRWNRRFSLGDNIGDR